MKFGCAFTSKTCKYRRNTELVLFIRESPMLFVCVRQIMFSNQCNWFMRKMVKINFIIIAEQHLKIPYVCLPKER